MKSLYQITEEHRALERLEEDGVDVGDTFESVDGEFSDKVLSAARLVRNIEAHNDSIRKEIDRLSDLLDGNNKKASRINDYVLENMQATGKKKISDGIFSVSIRKGRDVVHVHNIDELPADYLNIKTSMSPMKRDILRDLKDGAEIPGASITKSSDSLVIK